MNITLISKQIIVIKFMKLFADIFHYTIVNCQHKMYSRLISSY